MAAFGILIEAVNKLAKCMGKIDHIFPDQIRDLQRITDEIREKILNLYGAVADLLTDLARQWISRCDRERRDISDELYETMRTDYKYVLMVLGRIDIVVKYLCDLPRTCDAKDVQMALVICEHILDQIYEVRFFFSLYFWICLYLRHSTFKFSFFFLFLRRYAGSRSDPERKMHL